MTAILGFWVSAALMFYVALGYPLLLCFLQPFFRRPVRKKSITPTVSILVAAHNEADVIASKIRNAIALDYPPDRLEIVVASDGSTDATATIVRSLMVAHPSRHIQVLEFPDNLGKTAVLNESVPQVSGEIVVFSDASSMLEPNGLRNLVANFADPTVGAACGRYAVMNQDDATLGRQEGLYWKYETFLKEQEANIGALTGAHGALYAIRKNLFPFLHPATINDDFVIPTTVLAKGLRIAYEPSAIAREEAEQMGGFARRIRIAAGNFDQLREVTPLLWPLRPLALFCFLSHKAGRLLFPIAMLSLLLCNAFLFSHPAYRIFLWLQIAFYLLAVLGAIPRLRPKFLRLPFYFCMVNVSVLVWPWYRWLARKHSLSRVDRRRKVVWT